MSVPLTVVYDLLATIGIVFTIICLVFNFVFRKTKYVCCLLFVGCLVLVVWCLLCQHAGKVYSLVFIMWYGKSAIQFVKHMFPKYKHETYCLTLDFICTGLFN